jgi:glycosyltransferase involved in cell wall biosynthesis
MKVAFLSQPWESIRLPVDGRSSIATLTYHFARRLIASGSEVVMYSKRARDQAEVETDADGIKHIRLSTSSDDRLLAPLKAIERLTGFGNPKRPLFASPAFYGAYAREAARSMLAEGCDIAHVHNFSQYIPIIRSIHPGIRTVLHMHCNWLAELDASTIESRLAETDLVIGCSDHITESNRLRFPDLASRFHTVYNGADVEHFTPGAAPTPDSRRLVYVGRVSPEKGVHVLLDAFQRVLARHPDVELDIVGPPGLLAYEFIAGLSDDPVVATIRDFYGRGPLEKAKVRFFSRGKSYLARLEASISPAARERISFHTFIPHQGLVELYRSAAMIVFPSVCHEAFGMPLVEAMACGTPAVASKSGGAMEIVQPGRTGLLVERNDPRAMAEAIVALLEDPTTRAQMSRESRRVAAERFAWERGVDALQARYDELIA